MPGTNYNAPQFGVKFVLTRGAYRVTFNDPTDSDNIGSLTNIEGLDSPEVREQGENLQEFDGGIHADRFYFGRRPVTLSGVIHGHSSISARNTNLQKLMDVTGAMRDDMTITWQPSGGQEVFLNVRRQQPLRIEGMGLNKTFSAGMIAADPRIYSTATHTQAISGSPVTVTNAGNTPSPPSILVAGSWASGGVINIDGDNTFILSQDLPADKSLLLDVLTRAVSLGDRAVTRKNIYFNPTFTPGVTLGGGDTPNTTMSIPTSVGDHGSSSLAFTSSSSAITTMKWTLSADENHVSDHHILPPGTTDLTISMSGLRAPSGVIGPVLFMNVKIFDSADVQLSTTDYTGPGVGGGTWTPWVQSISGVPSNASYIKVQLGYTFTSIASGKSIYIDKMQIEPLATDGSFFYPGLTTNAAWLGTPDRSTSVVPGASTHTNPVQGYQYSFLGLGLDLEGSRWVGLPGGDSVVAVSGTLGPGFDAQMTWRDAWI